jgi:hypothetical protein
MSKGKDPFCNSFDYLDHGTLTEGKGSVRLTSSSV